MEPACRGAGLGCMYHRTSGMKAELLENFRKPFLFQVKFLIQCSTINHAEPFQLCSSLSREKWCAEELFLSTTFFLSPAGMCQQGHHLSFIGFKQSVIAWDYDFLACRIRRCNQFMKGTGLFFFSLKMCIYFCQHFQGPRLKKKWLLIRIYL